MPSSRASDVAISPGARAALREPPLGHKPAYVQSKHLNQETATRYAKINEPENKSAPADPHNPSGGGPTAGCAVRVDRRRLTSAIALRDRKSVV